MEPIEETATALRVLGSSGLYAAHFEALTDRVQALVPHCVGLSLTLIQHELTFSFLVSDEALRALDAAQYIDGGPCEASVAQRKVVPAEIDALDEGRWSLFAEASAAQGVRSSLSFPLIDDGQVVGGVNLYGSTPRAFDGHRTQIADLLGAWEAAYVTNADLTMASFEEAREAPERLEQTKVVDHALGMLIAARGMTLAEAQDVVRGAALRAGMKEADVAQIVVDFLRIFRES